MRWLALASLIVTLIASIASFVIYLQKLQVVASGRNPYAAIVFGGSTAHDTGNTDADTWPSHLSAMLGPDFAVENYGVRAYSSLEAMLQSLFVFRDRPPACALYYEGWNDLRNAHIAGLRNDYSDLELPHIAAFLRP